jgi:endonuclease/exonuclease/phosphatase family metal-dependent hydrolase
MIATLRTCVLILLMSAGAATAQINVRVLHYNIHRDIGGSDSNFSAQPALARIVNYLKPDVWTINELGGNNAPFSATAAHDYLIAFIRDNVTIFGLSPQENVNYFVYLSTFDDNFETVAIVSRYPFTSTTTYSDASGSFRALRGFPRASINVNGSAIDIFTAHLKALNSNTDAEKRQGEAQVDNSNMKSWLASHAADAVVVTGDWNETEEPGETTNWSGHHIGDLLPNNGEPYRPVGIMRSGLFDPRVLSVAGRIDTISSTKPTARFDYATYAQSRFVAGEVFDTKQYSAEQLTALNLANGTSFTASDSATASDHLPVLAVIQAGGPGQLLNISTRAQVSEGERVVISGLILTGNTSRRLLIRGIGPSLANAGVVNVLSDPALELYDSSGNVLAVNDNWKETQQQAIEATGAAPTYDFESAIVTTLPADGRSYTAVLRSHSQGQGIGLVEVYDLAPGTSSRLANISTRAYVGSEDDALIGGFIAGPGATGATKVIVRAIGPTLTSNGIANALPDPTITLYDGNGRKLVFNDDWKVREDGSSQQAEIEATTIPPKDDRESAIVSTLAPGNYTAIVRGKNIGTGVALVEAYNLNQP